MNREELSVKYVSLPTLELWDRNPKRHDLKKLAESIRRYGFKDPPRLEPSLNKGRGGIVEGNGRAMALRAMRDAGETPPRGIGIDGSGEWHVPILVGVDAASQAEAEKYGVDHNALTMAGGGLGFEDLLQVFDEGQLKALLGDLPDAEDLLVSFDSTEIDALLQGPEFDPVAASEQPRLDEKKAIRCPECGAEFRP